MNPGPGATGALVSPADGPPGAEARAGCGARVLLVDDRADNLLALAAVLDPLGFDLLTARSGAEALRLLLHEHVDAIVLDVQMPQLDGFETAAHLRTRSATRAIPILFLTAVYDSHEHELRGYDAGAFDYLCKPFHPEVLRAKVRTAVDWSTRLTSLECLREAYERSGASLRRLDASALGAPSSGESPAEARAAATRRPRGRAAAAGVARLVPAPGAAAQKTRRVCLVELAADPASPARARRAVAEAAGAALGEAAPAVAVLVSELVTNAVQHARSGATVTVDVGPRLVRVEVADTSRRLPAVRGVEPTRERGRGLRLVAGMASRYGWCELAGGKVVWFEIDLP